MCLNENFTKICIGKHLSDVFSVQHGLKQGGIWLLLILNFPLEYSIRKVQEN